MKTLKTLTLLTICVTSIALGDDVKTILGKEYKDATVTSVEPDGILVKYQSGISKLYFEELPKEVQDRFHYDPQRASTYLPRRQPLTSSPKSNRKKPSAGKRL